MIEKVRLDVAMLERGFVDSREKGKALIMAGLVYVNGQKETKAGTSIKPDDCIELRGEKMPYVSRGGYKLEKAVKEFNLSLDGCTCMDIGASTGGFTDCMLINGAVKVYSIDVGYGQLVRPEDYVVPTVQTPPAQHTSHNNGGGNNRGNNRENNNRYNGGSHSNHGYKRGNHRS